MQVHVKDGRVFVGQFYCLDAAGSLILMDAYELESASLLGRPLHPVMHPPIASLQMMSVGRRVQRPC